ncbi:MAG: hypothetical protein GKR97_17035 [Rhizobiaceae bacterium]|nr:hypothetical protein [Rhizobiaceae bacterium]
MISSSSTSDPSDGPSIKASGWGSWVVTNIEGIAEDGTVEAISVANARTFALGVQWHAEYDPHDNPVNQVLFEAFGDALRDARGS